MGNGDIKNYCKIANGCRAFSFFNKSGIGALLIHGFTSSCRALRELGKYLAHKNISVVAPRLAGHGTRLDDLRQTNCYDWFKSAEQGLKKLKAKTNHTYLIGDSFGGNLAFKLAAQYKVAGIVSLGAPIYLRKNIGIKLLLPIVSLFCKHYKKPRSHCSTSEEFTERGSYSKIPLCNLRQLLKFINKETKKDLSKVQAPTLIVQSITDNVVSPRSAKFIYQNLSSESKELFWLKSNSHQLIIIEQNRNKVFKRIYEFIQQNSR